MRPRDFALRFLGLAFALAIIYCAVLVIYTLHGLRLIGM